MIRVPAGSDSEHERDVSASQFKRGQARHVLAVSGCSIREVTGRELRGFSAQVTPDQLDLGVSAGSLAATDSTPPSAVLVKTCVVLAWSKGMTAMPRRSTAAWRAPHRSVAAVSEPGHRRDRPAPPWSRS